MWGEIQALFKKRLIDKKRDLNSEMERNLRKGGGRWPLGAEEKRGIALGSRTRDATIIKKTRLRMKAKELFQAEI